MNDLIKVFNRGAVRIPAYYFNKTGSRQWTVRREYDHQYCGTFDTRREAIRRCYEIQQSYINKMLKQVSEDY